MLGKFAAQDNLAGSFLFFRLDIIAIIHRQIRHNYGLESLPDCYLIVCHLGPGGQQAVALFENPRDIDKDVAI